MFHAASSSRPQQPRDAYLAKPHGVRRQHAQQQAQHRPDRRPGAGATAHFGASPSENIVALCDVNEDHLAFAAEKFPNAKTYVDWRKCLDQKDIDAVVCCTTDFTHAFVANWALNRGMHVYCEKPLGNTVEEARVGPRELPQEQEQAGHAARHAAARQSENFNRVRELIRDGAIGELKARLRLGQPPDPPARLPARRGRAAEEPPLRPVARARRPSTRTIPDTSPAARRQLPAMEHVLGLRQRPDRRHGQPHHGPRLERHRRRPADHRRGHGREVQSRK